MGEKKISRGGAVPRRGGVFVAGVECWRLHGTTSVDFERRRVFVGLVSPETGEGIHNLGEVGMEVVMTGFRGWRSISRYFRPCSC
jgi:hypothetical protein